MIQINQLKLPIKHTENDITLKVAKTLRINKNDISNIEVKRRSIDARNKDDIKYVYAVLVSINEGVNVKKSGNRNILFNIYEKKYNYNCTGRNVMIERPVIVGFGPAGLFCAYSLAKRGFKPIILEQGKSIEKRQEDVKRFWETGNLNLYSNVQFGEGGAGTFSDGKLNTLIKDSLGRRIEVLETFVSFGAPEDILFDSKPHIGTDILAKVITNMRTEIESMGGTVLFSHKLVDFESINECKVKMKVANLQTNKELEFTTETMILAIGHSARETFSLLHNKKLNMEPKSFAIGVRVEHKREDIDAAQYGTTSIEELRGASYKLTHKCTNGRGAYTFC
ncbi:MAG: NAD(P)/FAD-dependent oxidoreductase, partial [Suipraeoptans sp.]